MSSAHPKLPGTYLESGSCEGRPAYVKDGASDSQFGVVFCFLAAALYTYDSVLILYNIIHIYL